MSSSVIPLLLTLLSSTAAEGPRPERPVVAVFDIDAGALGLEPQTLDALTDYLTAQLAESSFSCVPRSELRLRLAETKAEGYRACYDQSCQIEVGREVAAAKTVATKILRLGEGCQVSAVLFDLRTATTESAATAPAACEEAAILLALHDVAVRLGKPAPAEVSTAATPIAKPAAADDPGPLVTCRSGDGGPAFLGWCSKGTFVGVVHLGLLVYAATADDVGGIAQTALVNRVGGSFYGAVQGGLLNTVGRNFYGLAEVSGANFVGGRFVGILEAGAYNQVDGSMTGIQAGVVNRAGSVAGLQVGVLNVTRHLSGVQIGLINWADNGLLTVLPILNAGF